MKEKEKNDSYSSPLISKNTEHVRSLFNDIASRYDITNHILSGGLDFYWRRKLLQAIPKQKDIALLDIATGTGGLPLLIKQKRPQVSRVVAIDISENMLQIAKKNEKSVISSYLVEWMQMDASEMHFQEEFQCATIAFGIRNMPSPEKVLNRIYAALQRDGVLCLLEFSLPHQKLLRKGYLFYLRHILPKIGQLCTNNYDAYRHLQESIETFPYGEQFSNIISSIGFRHVQYFPLSLGCVTIYIAKK